MAQKFNRTEIIEPDGETLGQALRRCYGDASRSLYSQSRLALTGLLLAEHGPGINVEVIADRSRAEDYGGRAVQRATSTWYHEGLSPATINKRLNCLSKMGVDVQGLRVKNPKQLKWHLKESDKPKVLEYLRSQQSHHWNCIAAFIEWTTLTGLRIEESLRLTWGDTSLNQGTISVPGTKTGTSQATLPLGAKAASLLLSLIDADPQNTGPRDCVFNLTYDGLLEGWQLVREFFGWQDDPTATLKALRRSAARYLHVDCGMPLHMVQQYLRHESMDTTLEYLRLTGGYGTEEMRRFLK
nr:site-specific integrase [uncultured Gellertiella sp.]